MFPENVERWSWGDVTRQTVPETVPTGNAVNNSEKPCMSNHQLQGWQPVSILYKINFKTTHLTGKNCRTNAHKKSFVVRSLYGLI